MIKLKKKKKKFKGTRYVANVLKKYFKKKYPTYTAALPKAREVSDKLRESGQKFTVKNVESIVRKHRIKVEPVVPIGKKPLLFYKLTTPLPYFDLQDYSTYINDTTSDIYFNSEIFNKGVESIQGGKRPSYQKTFSEFVNFVNKEIDSESDEYTEEYLIVCTPPQWSKENNRWETSIVTVNSNGEQTDYGYEPSAPSTIEEIDGKLPSERPKKEKTGKPTPKSEIIQEKELELKISKEKSRQQANELFLKGLYNKLEYKAEIERINNL
jgi:hypothetical protein